jgi:hypothetical protein
MIFAAEDRSATFGFIGQDGDSPLATAELLTGTPTVVAAPTGSTIDAVAVNSGTVTVAGVSHIAGKAVQFRVTGCTANITYRLTITATTDAATPNTVIGHCNLRCDE